MTAQGGFRVSFDGFHGCGMTFARAACIVLIRAKREE